MINVFIFILFSIISLLTLVHYFTNILANEGFKSPEHHVLSFIFPSLIIFMDIIAISTILKSNHYYLSFLALFLYHLVSFWLIHSILTIFMYFLQFTECVLVVYINHVFKKIKFTPIHIINPKLNIFPINKNVKLIRSLLLISYFFSIVAFKFFCEPFILKQLKFQELEIMKNTLTTYYDIFALSTLPVLYSYIKKS